MAAASVVLVGLVSRSMQHQLQLAEMQRLHQLQAQANAAALTTLRMVSGPGSVSINPGSDGNLDSSFSTRWLRSKFNMHASRVDSLKHEDGFMLCLGGSQLHGGCSCCILAEVQAGSG